MRSICTFSAGSKRGGQEDHRGRLKVSTLQLINCRFKGVNQGNLNGMIILQDYPVTNRTIFWLAYI